MRFAPMIWVSNTSNSLIYLSPEWTELTGQSVAEACGFGWLTPVHPDDRECVRSTYLLARAVVKPFEQKYRLQRKSGVYFCASASATPSFLTAASDSFLGYYGTIKFSEDETETFVAEGRVLEWRDQADVLDDEPQPVIEALADHLLRARGTPGLASDPDLIKIVDAALFEVGRRLAEPFHTLPTTQKRLLS